MRLRSSDRKTKMIVLKYRREDFHTFTKSRTLSAPTDRTSDVIQIASELLDEMRRHEPRPVRLIGVSLGSLVSKGTPSQLSLFDDQDHQLAEQKVDSVVDELSRKLGEKTVYRAASHQWRTRKR